MREGKHMTGCELKIRSSFQSQDKLWSDLKNLFSSYLLQLREARRREEQTESYFMGLSLSPAGSYNTAAALSPWSKADTHPLSDSSTDCHSSCQSTAIYLEAWGLLEREARAADGGRRWWRGETRRRTGEEAEGKGKPNEAGHSLQPRYGLCSRFSISISVMERAKRQGTEKNRISGMPFMSACFDLFSDFWQHGWSRRRDREEATEEGIRSCFDNLSPSIFSLLQPLPHYHHHQTHPSTSKNLWSARKPGH